MNGARERSIRIRARALAAIAEHAAVEAPLECCGLLVGDDDEIVEAHRARNTRDSATQYLIDPADHFAVLRVARARGLRVIGGYHSHPDGPPHPSRRDIDESPGEDWLHAIAVRTMPDGPFEVLGFYVRGGNFSPVPFVTVR